MRILAFVSLVVLALPALADSNGLEQMYNNEVAEYEQINAAFAAYKASHSAGALNATNCQQLAPLENRLQDILHDMRQLNYSMAMQYANAGALNPAQSTLYSLSNQMQAMTTHIQYTTLDPLEQELTANNCIN